MLNSDVRVGESGFVKEEFIVGLSILIIVVP